MAYTGTGYAPSIAKSIWVYPTIERVLKLCGVKSGKKVVVYTDTNRNKDISDMFFGACVNLGADVIEIVTTPRFGSFTDESRNPPKLALEVMKKSDLVIDLPTNHWAYTSSHDEVLDAGAYMLLSETDEELIVRLAPTEETVRRTENGAEMLTRAKSIRIVSEAGTDLTFSVEGRTCIAETGIVGGSKKFDVFPASLIEIPPIEDSTKGILVVAPGDPIVEFNKLVDEPIKCTIKDGRIVTIEGGRDAIMFKEWYAQWDDPNVYVTAHIGFGTHHNADLLSGQAMDWESLCGGVNIAFGANKSLGGNNLAKGHMDIIIRHADFYADDEILVKGGKLVHEALK